MELPKAYNPAEYEDTLYAMWESSGAFQPSDDPTKPAFTITMPPPNATGQLHMGHAAMLALEDLMTRYHRMKGDATLWIPGTDHAGIATQNMVEKKLLAEENKTRHDFSREAFVEKVRDFAESSKDRIRGQVRRMGSSCDWSRERYTLSEDSSAAVTEAFVRMYEDDLIYRGYRIVNWCTRCQSTLSDDEVEYKSETTKFYYLKYGPVTIGTARPETKFDDKVIVVHPEDERYFQYFDDVVDGRAVNPKELKWFDVPWITGTIKAAFLADEAANREMGSGAMTITPGHSFIDFDLAKKYGFEVKKIIDERGMITEHGGPDFAGMDVKTAREKVVAALDQKGLVERIDENYQHNLSVCYRCKTAIEPLPSEQWFIDMNKVSKKLGGKSLKERAAEVVRDGSITLVPDRFEKTYFHWMDNLRDWCISRQIWWGHRIPAWHCQCGEWTVSKIVPNACSACTSTKFTQDSDTLDTWFSSALWTFSTLGWPEKSDDLKRFHPTSVMETGYDILFFWVARMIIMSTYHLGAIPFETVYLHGLVRDRDGDKMSKSKPETMIDPLEVCEKYGTDAVRLSLVIGTSPGGDSRLFEEKIAGYRNFTNKVWNVARFILMNVEPAVDQHPFNMAQSDKSTLSLADKWILSRLQHVIRDTTKAIEEFQFSEGGNLVYEFLWNELADWYVEMSKVEKNAAILLYCLETTLKLLHPWMPFVTEQIYSHCLPEPSRGMLITAQWPVVQESLIDPEAERAMQTVIDAVNGIRSLRSDAGIDPGKKITVIIVATDAQVILDEKAEVIRKLARIESLTITDQKPSEKCLHKVLELSEIFIPASGIIDIEHELAKSKDEIEKLSIFIIDLEQKLANKGFVDNAPKEIVAHEIKKLNQAKEKTMKLVERVKEFE